MPTPLSAIEVTNMGKPLIPVQLGHNSSFSAAIPCDHTLIVFVHGFRGKASATWQSFPDYLDEYDGLRDADVLYYGYDSRLRMQNISINLRKDLNAIWQNCLSLGTNISQIMSKRSDSFTWKKIVFVAHSLGAVVVRRTLLDCFLDESDIYDNKHWSRNATICLFAPAHSGANLLKLISETFITLGLPFVPFIKMRYPCLQDLEIGSQSIEVLKQDYLELPPDKRNFIKATLVILAEKDQVVEPTRFPGDPIADHLEDRGHINVCKPDDDFIDPVTKLCTIWSKESHIKDNSRKEKHT